MGVEATRIDGVPLVVTWGDRKTCDTLLTVFDLGSRETLLSVQYEGRARGGAVVRDSGGRGAFWFSVGERLYRAGS